MTERYAVRFFECHGFCSKGRTQHKKSTNSEATSFIKRYIEIEDEIFEKLKKGTGLK